jgi:hypothetical protein
MRLRIIGRILHQLRSFGKRPILIRDFAVPHHDAFAGWDSISGPVIFDIPRSQRVGKPQTAKVGLAIGSALDGIGRPERKETETNRKRQSLDG